MNEKLLHLAEQLEGVPEAKIEALIEGHTTKATQKAEAGEHRAARVVLLTLLAPRWRPPVRLLGRRTGGTRSSKGEAMQQQKAPALTKHEQHLIDGWHAAKDKGAFISRIPAADASRLVDLLNDIYKPPPTPPFKRRQEQAA